MNKKTWIIVGIIAAAALALWWYNRQAKLAAIQPGKNTLVDDDRGEAPAPGVPTPDDTVDPRTRMA